MKTKATVDEALARLSRAIDRPWDNGSLPSYADNDPPLTRFIHRWTRPPGPPRKIPSDTGVAGARSGTLFDSSEAGSSSAALPKRPPVASAGRDSIDGRAVVPAGRDSPDACPVASTGRSPAGARPVASSGGNQAHPYPTEDPDRPCPRLPATERFEPAGDLLDEPDPPPRRRRRLPRAAAVIAVAVGALLAGLIALPGTPEAPAAPSAAALPVEQPKPPVTVDVQGKVKSPGVRELPAGSRVIDALTASGGPLPGTETTTLNLARRLVDGEQINVGITPQQAADPAAPPLTNLNTAPVYQLDALPGVGIVTAQRIVEYRNRHGGFTEVSQLRQVEGIGPARYEKLKDLVTVN